MRLLIEKRLLVLGGAAMVLLLALLAVVLQGSDPQRGSNWRIVIGTPGAQYDELAKTFRHDLEHNGVGMELRPSEEGFATFSTLLDNKSGMNAAVVKGGLFGSLKGRLASVADRDLHDLELAKLRSLGRLF